MACNPELGIRDVGSIRVLTIDRPHRMNAIDRAMGTALASEFRRADATDSVRVVVLTGAGDRAFSAGGDLKEMSRLDVSDGSHRIVYEAMKQRTAKPLVAAVNGLAYGGGLELVAGCDLAVAVSHATFALPEATRGLVASGGGLVRLPCLVGERRALELALTGRVIDASTAEDWGLVNAVVPASELDGTAMALAESIAASAPLSVMASRSVIVDGSRMTTDDAWSLNDRHQRVIAASQDSREGPRAFAEGREPVWSGR